MRKNWHYWMYKSALKNGFGSLMPDFPQFYLLTKKQFDEAIMGQTLRRLTKTELNELKIPAGIK